MTEGSTTPGIMCTSGRGMIRESPGNRENRLGIARKSPGNRPGITGISGIGNHVYAKFLSGGPLGKYSLGLFSAIISITDLLFDQLKQ